MVTYEKSSLNCVDTSEARIDSISGGTSESNGFPESGKVRTQMSAVKSYNAHREGGGGHRFLVSYLIPLRKTAIARG